MGVVTIVGTCMSAAEGTIVGTCVSAAVGTAVDVGMGVAVGRGTGTDGSVLGKAEGRSLGRAEGAEDGTAEGRADGLGLGSPDGRAVGTAVGRSEGRGEGDGVVLLVKLPATEHITEKRRRQRCARDSAVLQLGGAAFPAPLVVTHVDTHPG